MDPTTELQTCALCITGWVLRITAKGHSVDDGLKRISNYADRMEGVILKVEREMLRLRIKAQESAQQHWTLKREKEEAEKRLMKENAELKNKLMQVEEELQSSQQSLPALFDDGDDDTNDDHEPAQEAISAISERIKDVK